MRWSGCTSRTKGVSLRAANEAWENIDLQPKVSPLLGDTHILPTFCLGSGVKTPSLIQLSHRGPRHPLLIIPTNTAISIQHCALRNSLLPSIYHCVLNTRRTKMDSITIWPPNSHHYSDRWQAPHFNVINRLQSTTVVIFIHISLLVKLMSYIL